MDELAGTENRLANERMRYNEKVQEFNTMVRRFPANLMARMFGFKEARTSSRLRKRRSRRRWTSVK